ncbi:MAG: hypothetical protein EAZ60_19145 [Oscillatoriales cyanobacterium]|nr:MAG: hypothetical protein EAZ60_19145 [Oscillatoriales cyanobacterium]
MPKIFLLNLLGQAIEAMPSIAAAVVVIVLTNTAAKFVSRAVSAATQQTVKSLSLRSLFVQTAVAKEGVSEGESGRVGEWESGRSEKYSLFLMTND